MSLGFIRTTNIDGYQILIPVDSISEIILYDKAEDDNEYFILLFSKNELGAIGREEYDDVDTARMRFETLSDQLCSPKKLR